MTDAGTTSLWVSVGLPIGTAAVGALAGIGGGIFGALTGARRAHSQWLTGKRAEACERYFSLLKRADKLFMSKYQLEKLDPEDHDELERTFMLIREVRELMDDFRDATTTVEMYGSDDLRYRATEANSLFQMFMEAPPSDADGVSDWFDSFNYASREVELEIRKELRISDKPPE